MPHIGRSGLRSGWTTEFDGDGIGVNSWLLVRAVRSSEQPERVSGAGEGEHPNPEDLHGDESLVFGGSWLRRVDQVNDHDDLTYDEDREADPSDHGRPCSPVQSHSACSANRVAGVLAVDRRCPMRKPWTST